MRNRISIVLLFFAAVFLAMPGHVSGQTTPTGTNSATDQASQKPYTATYRITVIDKQADGSTVTRQSTETVALDSAGRWMDSTASLPTAADPSPMRHIRVDDPVARTSSLWGVPGKQAIVIAMPPPSVRLTCPPATRASDPAIATPRPGSTVQDLGTQTIQGVEAHGRRTIFALPPALAAESNARQPNLEVWNATDSGLNGLMVRSLNIDPRGNQTIRELESVTEGEPDPSLFQPPVGVHIVNRPAAVPSCPGAAQASTSQAPIPSAPAR